MGVFHRMFCDFSTFQEAGVSFSVARPVARAPRNEGQLVWANTLGPDIAAHTRATPAKAGIGLALYINSSLSGNAVRRQIKIALNFNKPSHDKSAFGLEGCWCRG